MKKGSVTVTRGLVVVLMAAAALVAAAEEAGAAKPALTPEERQARMLATTGGLLTAHGQGGTLLLLDMTGGRAGGTVAETAKLLGDVLKLKVRAEAGEPPGGGDPSAGIRAALGSGDVAAVVAVVADRARPALLVAPEDRWAAVNAARVLDAGGDTRDVRLRKQIWRAAGLMMGAGNTGSPQCPFRPVLSVSDLDAFSGFQLAPATLAAVSAYARAAGLAQSRQTTYRRACEEGWAPAPTNDVQKAVWDEVRARAR